MGRSALLVAALAAALTAQRSGAGCDCRIAFATDRDDGNVEIYVMEEDGSNPVNLTNNPARDWEPAVTADGTRFVFASDRSGFQNLWVMAVDGSNLVNVTDTHHRFGLASWSPDGGRIAVTSNFDGPLNIFLIDAVGTNMVNLTRHPEEDAYPAWSPDGGRIAFHTLRDGNLEVYAVDPDGSNLVNLTNDPAADSRPAWSPDGSRIAFTSRRNGGDIDIFTMNADGSDPVDLTRNEGYADYWPAWSPDGTRIAFASNRDGDFDIYVMDADVNFRSNPVNLTRTTTDAIYPAWIPAQAASAIRAASWGAVKARVDRGVTPGAPDPR